MTETVEPRTSMVSHAVARASPSTSRKACRSRYSATRPDRGCRASTRGRTLPSLSTGFHRPPLDAAHDGTPDHRFRERVRLDRRDDHLAGFAELLQQGPPTPGV